MQIWILFLAAAGPTSTHPESHVLAHIVEDPAVRADRLVIEGRLCARRYREAGCDRAVRALIDRRDGTLRLSVDVASGVPMTARVPLAGLPDLDLLSARLFGHYSPDVFVLFELRFGESNSCFVNDDGRGRLSISLRQAADPEIRIYRYDDCVIRTGTLEAEPDGGG